jgi:Skp family chaperone for outer membrane proteins
MKNKFLFSFLLVSSAARPDAVLTAATNSVTWIPIIAAIGVGSIVAALVGWFSAKTVAISNNRQNWINGLRDDIAEFLKEIDLLHLRLSQMHRDGATTDDLDKKTEARAAALLLYRRIRMRLNMTETPSLELRKALDALNTIDSSVADEARIEAVLHASSVVFKQEWAVTKYGILARPIMALKKLWE